MLAMSYSRLILAADTTKCQSLLLVDHATYFWDFQTSLARIASLLHNPMSHRPVSISISTVCSRHAKQQTTPRKKSITNFWLKMPNERSFRTDFAFVCNKVCCERLGFLADFDKPVRRRRSLRLTMHMPPCHAVRHMRSQCVFKSFKSNGLLGFLRRRRRKYDIKVCACQTLHTKIIVIAYCIHCGNAQTFSRAKLPDSSPLPCQMYRFLPCFSTISRLSRTLTIS